MGSEAGVAVEVLPAEVPLGGVGGVPDPVPEFVLDPEELVLLPAEVPEFVPAPVELPAPEAEEPAPLVPPLLPVEPVLVLDPVFELPVLPEPEVDPAEEDVPEEPALLLDAVEELLLLVLPAAFAGAGEAGCTLPQPAKKSPKYRAGTNKNVETSRCITLPRRSYRHPANKTELCIKLRQR